MFSRAKYSTKPLVCFHPFKLNSSSQLEVLPNGLILSVENISKHTVMQLFNPRVNQLLHTAEIKGEYTLMAVLSQKIFLIGNDQELIRISVDSLAPLDRFMIANRFGFAAPAFALNAHQVIFIDKKSPNSPCYIKQHDFNSQVFNTIISEAVFTVDKTAWYFSAPIPLSANQWTFKSVEEDSDYFEVIVLNNRLDTNKLTVEARFSLARQYQTSDSYGNSGVTKLSNGDILTYNTKHYDFQVWRNGRRIDQWNWQDLDSTIGSHVHWRVQDGMKINTVCALPDNTHLLILESHQHLWLLNRHTRCVKTVELPFDYFIYQIKGLLNGQVLIHASVSGEYQPEYLARLDFKELLPYRRRVFLELRKKGLPNELNTMITDYLAPDSPWTISHSKLEDSSFCITM